MTGEPKILKRLPRGCVVRNEWELPAGTLEVALITDDPVSPGALLRFGEIVRAVEESGLVPDAELQRTLETDPGGTTEPGQPLNLGEDGA